VLLEELFNACPYPVFINVLYCRVVSPELIGFSKWTKRRSVIEMIVKGLETVQSNHHKSVSALKLTR